MKKRRAKGGEPVGSLRTGDLDYSSGNVPAYVKLQRLLNNYDFKVRDGRVIRD